MNSHLLQTKQQSSYTDPIVLFPRWETNQGHFMWALTVQLKGCRSKSACHKCFLSERKWWWLKDTLGHISLWQGNRIATSSTGQGFQVSGAELSGYSAINTGLKNWLSWSIHEGVLNISPYSLPYLLFLTKQLPLRKRDNLQANKNNKKKALLAFISLKTLEELGESAAERVWRVSRL